MSTSPDPNAPYWTRRDVAAYLGWVPQTVSSYLSAKRLPEPSSRIEGSPIWEPKVIIDWNEGGRPKQNAS
ncbi:hypothetical protein ACFXPR_36175 [Nocardia tengchongensis]|uniref:hypothetical protein n=1 Tax=Nocardia tengchongensis TaxID=2055889 RepID=UPI003681C2DB